MGRVTLDCLEAGRDSMDASRDLNCLLAWKTCCFYYLAPTERRNKISVPIDTGVLTGNGLQHLFSKLTPGKS